MYAYQGLRHVWFSENFAYKLNEWSQSQFFLTFQKNPKNPLTLFSTGLLRAAQRWNTDAFLAPFSEVYYIYPWIKKFGSNILAW